MPIKKLDRDPRTKAEKSADARILANALSEEPCEVCLALAKTERLRMEAVQRVRVTMPPRHTDMRPCCADCQAASSIHRIFGARYLTFEMARVAVANDRQEQYRMPGLPSGLVKAGLVRPCEPGDMEDQHAWLYRHNWFDQNPPPLTVPRAAR